MASFNQKFVDWIMDETRPLDIVASWETLCNVYHVLEFSDDISDTVKLEEFKWIIKEMNKHLTRARKKLLTCEEMDSLMEVLKLMYSPSGAITITSRKDIAYHKLRQKWIDQMIMKVSMIEEEEENVGTTE